MQCSPFHSFFLWTLNMLVFEKLSSHPSPRSAFCFLQKEKIFFQVFKLFYIAICIFSVYIYDVGFCLHSLSNQNAQTHSYLFLRWHMERELYLWLSASCCQNSWLIPVKLCRESCRSSALDLGHVCQAQCRLETKLNRMEMYFVHFPDLIYI